MFRRYVRFFLFFFNDTATTEIYTLSLHDALPISQSVSSASRANSAVRIASRAVTQPEVLGRIRYRLPSRRSEEHTSELQSHLNLVCRLLLEKKKEAATAKVNTYLAGIDALPW